MLSSYITCNPDIPVSWHSKLIYVSTYYILSESHPYFMSHNLIPRYLQIKRKLETMRQKYNFTFQGYVFSEF